MSSLPPIRIDSLPPAENPTRQHLLGSMLAGKTETLSIFQILSLIELGDIQGLLSALNISFDPGETDLEAVTVQAAIVALAGRTIPTGFVGWTAQSTPPAGFIKANGAAVSRTTYSALFAAIGTTYGSGDGSTSFNLPDLRGEFIRGWDDGRGVDSGRALGSAQLDQMQRITGSSGEFLFETNSGVGAFTNTSRTTAAFYGTSSISGGVGTSNFDSANSPDARVSSTTSGETRPRNVALLACIKF